MFLKYHTDPKYLLGSIGVTTPPILCIKKEKATRADGFGTYLIRLSAKVEVNIIDCGERLFSQESLCPNLGTWRSFKCQRFLHKRAPM